jgi:hypothetical protein
MATYDLVGSVMIWKHTLDATGKVTVTAEDNMKNDTAHELSRFTAGLKANDHKTILDLMDTNMRDITIPAMKDKNVSGWHAMKLCDMFGVTYDDANATRLKEVDAQALLGAIPIDAMDMKVESTNKYIDGLYKATAVATLVNLCVKKLNEAGLEQITYANMSRDGSLGQDLLGGGSEETGSLNVLQRVLDSYRYDLKNYMVGGTPAYFDMGEEMFGGVGPIYPVKSTTPGVSQSQLTSFQAKELGLPESNKSSHYFEKLFENIQTALHDNGREIDGTTITNLRDAIESLRKAENELIKGFDAGIVGLTVGKPAKVTSPLSGSQKTDYKKLFDSVETIGRRESRILNALSALVGYLVPVTPGVVGLRLR